MLLKFLAGKQTYRLPAKNLRSGAARNPSDLVDSRGYLAFARRYNERHFIFS
jgi:hypothetical protein